MIEFREFFRKATGSSPYPYQLVLAESEELPSLLSIPTGCGKTAAVILSWIWRRRNEKSEVRKNTPRRLIYCLPMRVLVEQTVNVSKEWLKNLSNNQEDLHVEDLHVTTLMGGFVDRDWDRFPERDSIIVGTQDMLLSRALNRGYTMSRYRWPLQFALLNNDCLWIMDEIQLMGDGLATSAQLQAFRRLLGATHPVRSIWMSATMRPEWLHTIDFDETKDSPGPVIRLSEEDKKNKNLMKKFKATKKVEFALSQVTKDGKKEAEEIYKKHVAGSKTLVIVNTVKRAQDIFKELEKQQRENNSKPKLLLVHSRFRPGDREKQIESLLAPPDEPGIIAVCTQVVEAGVDVSAKTLFTDLAPWASLVQRFGRCNRNGDDDNARVIVFIPEDLEKGTEKHAPYALKDKVIAKKRLEDIDDVGPRNLPPFVDPMPYSHVIRLKDLVELFDTTADLAGADVDVSRFIRETNKHDVQVFWRMLEDKNEFLRDEQKEPSRKELCSVPIWSIKDWIKRNKKGKKGRAWLWDHLDEKWRIINESESIYPGLVLMLNAEDGGYSSKLGWDGASGKVDPVDIDRHNNNKPSYDYSFETLTSHTDKVVKELDELLKKIPVNVAIWEESLRHAARWHDIGKIHKVCQNAFKNTEDLSGENERQFFLEFEKFKKSEKWGRESDNLVLAKTFLGKFKKVKYSRPGFRHELASAVTIVNLSSGENTQSQFGHHPDLVAYLVASHHGKVRLSLRSLPIEKHPDDDPKRRFARGIWDGDVLAPCELGRGVNSGEVKIDLSCMEIGEGRHGKSWISRMIDLRDEIGPFRLAFLEALIRLADWRASVESG